jgi:hypothetical protein
MRDSMSPFCVDSLTGARKNDYPDLPEETQMKNSLIVGLMLIVFVAGFGAGWFARLNTARPDIAGPNLTHPTIGRGTTMGDEHEAWANVPPTSPEYATAQRLLGYNYFAHDKHDLIEAKRHVDLALSVSPNDPKVLEDAGRVYVLAGLTDEGNAMLKKADTPIAREFLARR